MYVCLYVCMYVRMYICVYVLCAYVRTYVCLCAYSMWMWVVQALKDNAVPTLVLCVCVQCCESVVSVLVNGTFTQLVILTSCPNIPRIREHIIT